MKNPEVVFSRQKLLEIASGTNFDVSDRIIDAHIKSIRKKIEGDRKNPALLVTVHGLGYKFCGNSK
jgi:DNA-binding response OmpR family regulator